MGRKPGAGVHRVEMDAPGTCDDRLEHSSPELPQRLLNAVQNVNAPRDQLRVTSVPFLVEPVDLPLGNALFQGQIERAPPLFEGNPAEELLVVLIFVFF